jgi:hypothetical protein
MQLDRRYRRIASDCVLVTAADSKYAPYMFNAIASIHDRFPDHPSLHVFDLGMSCAQRSELTGVSWIQLRSVERFVDHWKQNWSWKPYILTQLKHRYVFYFDSANIVLMRSLASWYGAIARNGYLLIANGQRMNQITPPEYWKLFDCDRTLFGDAPTFGAGLMGFDREGFADKAIADVLARTIEGWTLGRSVDEVRRTFDHSVIRDCECFRADQTLFNLAFRKICGGNLLLRDELKYCGLGGAQDHARQYLWYSRRKRSSLIYIWTPIGTSTVAYYFNRLTFVVWLWATECARPLWRLLQSAKR